jgi:iron complex outermembrane recepter protein
MALKNTLLLLVLFLMLSAQAFAQRIIKVLDARDQSPIEGVSVRIASQNRVYLSDKDGKVSLSENESLQVEISFLGYKTQRIEFKRSESLLIIALETEDILLKEIMVKAFEAEKPLFYQAAGVHFLDNKAIYRFQESSLVPAINTLPGIRMEERSPASFRVGIRGSSIRSPFGVRNVKVYWNNIPLTEPGGSTPLNLLDVENVGHIEVIKGPTGSIYGAGTGGTILFTQKEAEPGLSASAFNVTGSYGLDKYGLAIGNSNHKGGFRLSATSQVGDGYRDHSAFDRKVIQADGYLNVSERVNLNGFLLLSNLNYQIPGAITAQQKAENPRMARPGSASQNSSIEQKYALFGMGINYSISNALENSTSFYLNASDFDNPFILDYKRDKLSGIGMRTRFKWDIQTGTGPLQLIWGMEFQEGGAVARNFGNRNGIADTLRFDDELQTRQSVLFAQAEWQLPANFSLTAGLSMNQLYYDVNRIWDSALRRGYQFDRKFSGIVAPRIAVLNTISPNQVLHFSINRGFSPPTIQEVRTNEGSINTNLEPEKGINYELGYRYRTWQNRLQLDLSLFHFRLQETIVSRTNPDGVVLFRNAGETRQNGAEMLLNWQLIPETKGKWGVNFQTAYTLHQFEFYRYTQNVNDFSGNSLTGVAPNVWINTLDIKHTIGAYLNLSHNFTDEIPLNDANTVYAPAYHLVQLRIGKFFTGRNQKWEAFFGVDNLLNESYSLGDDLNAFAGRFYQPAPERNYFMGLKWRFNKG